jgi:hypothetical protein
VARCDLPLGHWCHDVWSLGKPGGGTAWACGDRLVSFRLHKKGEAEGFQLLGEEFRREAKGE